MELETSNKFGLWWSKYCVIDDDWNLILSNDYLYFPERFSECFWILFERLSYTHDYCLHQLITSQEKLDELRKESEDNPHSEEHHYWEYNVDVISKSTVLIMMSSFVEWGLKRVAVEFSVQIRPKTNRRVSDVDHYIACIKESAFKDLDLPEDTLKRLNHLRKLRNKFAHGEWELIEPLLKELTFKETFCAISDLFENIEELAWRNEWGVDG